MLKRLFLFLLASMTVALPLAQAETSLSPENRQETIMLEGMEEEIITVRFESERGYVIWYDPQIITPVEEDEGVGMDTFVSANPNALPGMELSIHYAGALGYTFDAAVNDVKETLIVNYGESNIIEESTLFQNYSHQGYYTNSDDKAILSYVVDEGEGAFYIVLTYPAEAAEGFGSRVLQMLQSFEITMDSIEISHEGSIPME